MFFSSKKVLGLDIGSSSIKVAEVDLKRSGAVLSKFGIIPTPEGSVSGSEISNPAVVGNLVRDLLAQTKMSRKSICGGLWGTSVIVKKITIPKIEKKFIAQQIRFEAEQYIPFDVNEINLDYHLLPNTPGVDTLDILLVAAQKAIVGQHQQVAASCGLKLKVVDVNGFALANCFEINYGKPAGQVIGLLNIGCNVTNFVVVLNGEVLFSRDIPIGGATFTNELLKNLGVTYAEAEALKISSSSGSREFPDQVPQIMSSTLEMVAEEIRNSFDFFNASSGGQSISSCFATGGGASTPNLLRQISQAVNIPIEPLNPFLRVKGTKNLPANYLSQIAPFAAIAIGLGSRKDGDK